MEDFIYLDDYINYYSKKDNKIIKILPYKDTLKYGRIINREKFIKKMNKVLLEYHINKNIFTRNIKVIINKNISIEDKLIIKDALEILNFKKVNFVKEVVFLNIDKNKLYINFNNSYFYFYYVNRLGNIEMLIYDNNKINKELIIKIIDLLGKEKIIVYGKNYLELINLLEDNNYNYYFYEESVNLILRLVIKSSVKF